MKTGRRCLIDQFVVGELLAGRRLALLGVCLARQGGGLPLPILAVGHGSRSTPAETEGRGRRAIAHAAAHHHISGCSYFPLLQQTPGKDSYVESALVLALD